MGKRTEKDSMGEVKVPEDAYYGSFTSRALENFKITPENTHEEFYHALGQIKKAAAQVNNEIGNLEDEKADAIVKASEQVVEGDFDDEFVLDPIQAGAGTPFHMNANEIIANRATEILGGEKGEYTVHPNDHVNIGQSSNNVIPTAVRLACLQLSDRLIEELDSLEETFRQKASQFEEIVKVGRTHLQDAVPVGLGQEFGAYATVCSKAKERIERSRQDLLEIGLGGNAIGTGINTSPDFREKLASRLSEVAGRDLRASNDPINTTQFMSEFVEFSSSITAFASDMIKLSDDLMMLCSGPVAGIGEIDLPEVEPGSSIMPGKVNPSIVEAFKMSCIQAKANESAVRSCAEHGDLDMNVMAPLIARNLFHMLKMLENSLEMLRKRCIEGIEADEDRIEEFFEGSTATATALSPYIGYHRTAELVRTALSQDKTIKEVAIDRRILTEQEAEEILDPDNMTQPSGIDQQLRRKIQDRLED
ncbi:MAG: aspartate ammonia-lyase [Candidatus Nanohaloarchaea archaeon]|nr:aspartate ammonia-lyase [Candidatus Nanohaloarchaea archaeon]